MEEAGPIVVDLYRKAIIDLSYRSELILEFYFSFTSQVYTWSYIINIHLIFTGFIYNFRKISRPP